MFNEEKIKTKQKQVTKPKIPWIFGIKILVNLDN